MNDQPDWKKRIEHELATGERAQSQGNQGMARVCARRAAGIAIAEYLQRQGYQARKPSAIEQLRFLAALPQAPDQIREIARHFLVHLDTDHRLPVDADLLAEARWLIQHLLS